MAVNLVYGRVDPESSIDESYAKTRELIHRFEAQFGSTDCRALIGCDLSTQAGREYFKQNNLLKKCQDFTKAAAQIVSQLL